LSDAVEAGGLEPGWLLDDIDVVSLIELQVTRVFEALAFTHEVD